MALVTRWRNRSRWLISAAQVDVAILEPHFLADVLVELERQRLGTVEHRQRPRQQLDLARGQVHVGGALRPQTDKTSHLDHEFTAQALGFAKQHLVIRVEDDLQQAFAIAQVDEDHSAMVTAAMDPAGDGNFLAGQLLADLAAIMAAHGGVLAISRWKNGCAV